LKSALNFSSCPRKRSGSESEYDVPLPVFECRNAVPAFVADTAMYFLRAFAKSVAVRCDFRAQNTPKCVCGRGLATDSTGRVYSVHAGFQRTTSQQGREGRTGDGMEEENGRERKGRRFPHFLFYSNHW